MWRPSSLDMSSRVLNAPAFSMTAPICGRKEAVLTPEGDHLCSPELEVYRYSQQNVIVLPRR